MNVKKAILRGFDSGAYTATIELSGSGKVYLDGIAVGRSMPEAEMVNGRGLVVVFFDAHNVKDAVIVAVYT